MSTTNPLANLPSEDAEHLADWGDVALQTFNPAEQKEIEEAAADNAQHPAPQGKSP